MSPEPQGSEERKPGGVWARVSDGNASAGYDLSANILVGLGLGWLAQKFWPNLHPWGYAAGIVLGSFSGFYQLFKGQQRNSRQKKTG